MKKIILLVLLQFSVIYGFSQSLMEIQNVKVDNLSDAQIEQLIKRAEASGLNEQQLEAMALERGMPMSEVAKLRQRISSLKTGAGKSNSQDALSPSGGKSTSLRTVEGQVEEVDPFDSLRKSDPYYDLTPVQKKIFGYKLFHNKKVNFNPSLNIPTPPNYTLGAGDQLFIDVYGASQQSYDLTVNPEGKILIPNVGSVQIGGSSVAAASSRIKSALTQIYSGLSAGNTFLEIRLGNIKTVNISMVGELNRPGSYALPSFASPINALFAAGGPNENGSFRHVQVYRDSRLLREVDVYEFISKGELSSTLTLRDNDVIIVPPVRNRVEIVGPVRREGFFELKPGETLTDLFQFAGGFGSDAYKERITISRKTGKEMKVEDVDQGNFSAFLPQDGDVLRVGMIQNRFENRVQISGAVQRPGTFALTDGMGLRALIQKAEGLREDAFLNRATLYRTKADFSMEIVGVDVQAIVNGQIPDIQLRKEDLLLVPSVYDLKEEYYLKISGEVNRPGTFPFGDRITVADLVLKAGGFKESATSSRIEIARRVKDDTSGKLAEIIIVDIDKELRLIGDNANLELNPFDHVMVRRSPGFQRAQLVNVEGEAMYPGEFAIAHANERISDLLKRAGGLTPYAYPKGATLIRRNEFFENLTDDEIKLANLEQIREVIKKDSLDWTASERVLMSSIDKKLLEKAASEEKNKLVSDIRKESLMTLAESDDSIKDLKIKDVELIGLDLPGILKNPYGPLDLILKEGDVLSIPKELQTVRMRGEVLFPTTARYNESNRFGAYISKSGGFTDNARKGRSYVVYANGDVKRTNKFIFFNVYPKIEPGSEIIIPSKPEREGMSAQSWIGIATSLATIGILLNTLINSNN